MMVGPSGSGKSKAWQVLLKALERLEGTEGVAHVIDPKVTDLMRNNLTLSHFSISFLGFVNFLGRLKGVFIIRMVLNILKSVK